MEDSIRLALDPGNEQTGWVSYRSETNVPGDLIIVESGISDNYQIREMLRSIPREKRAMLAIETPKPRGQLTSSEEFETCIMIGRFLQVWAVNRWSYVHRGDIKHYITGMVTAKDSHVRQALLDRFGGKTHAVGGKRCKKCSGKGWRGRDHAKCEFCGGSGYETQPGPLYGVKSHIWAALSVACYQAAHPQSLQAIMLKDTRDELAKNVNGNQPLTAVLRRKFGLHKNTKKKKKKGAKS